MFLKENEDNYVNIEDIECDIFKVFLRFIYSGQVDKLDEIVSDLLAAADKYDVQPLKEVCVHHMAKNISVDNAVDIFSVASDYLKKNFNDVTRTDSWTSLFAKY